jgi:hypothetical protein
MKISIPASVDVRQLLQGLNLSKTKTKSLISKTQYFLSLITPNNFNYEEFEKNKGYRNISSRYMKKVLGNKDFYLILEVLKNPEIINCNNSYFNHPSLGFCKGYRLNEKYNTGKMFYKILDDSLVKKINKFKELSSANDDMNYKYKFLINQFHKHQLSIDESVYEYIKNLGNHLLSLVGDRNTFQTKLIYNKIGQLIYYVECINQRDIWSKVSTANHRLNSNLTSLPKVIRPFILCNDKPLTIVDIKSSQPYLLSSIMNNKFFTDISNGYNLKTINYELYQELIKNNTIINKFNINNLEYNSNSTGCTIYNYHNSNTGTTGVTPPIMWCNFFNTIDTSGIKNYIQSPFNDDFYLHTIKIKYPELSIEELSQKRDEMKKNMMYFLFDNNAQHRKNNSIIQLLSGVYPSVEEWIGNIHSTIGKQKFAYILQRSESYLILNEICREFNSLNPTIPLFTIHDAILTHDQYIPDLTSLILKRCKEITGIEVGCKISTPEINCNPSLEDIEHIWNKIKNINTEKKFKELEGVFEHNILKGQDFLKN